MQTTDLLYSPCNTCPRKCNSKRNDGQKGFCLETRDLRIAWAGLHFGEEPLITAKGGSGTIFITGCNLHCAFCQNYQISQRGMGTTVTAVQFSDICLKLQDRGAENINIVTGSHAIPVLRDYLLEAKKRGLQIPVCWNSSAYETPESLELLKDVVSIWLPDLKTLNPIISQSVFDAPDYPKAAKTAIRYMVSNTKTIIDDKNNKMLSGVIVRHLMLPGRLDDTKLVLEWFKTHADGKSYLSLMSQYTPVPFDESEMKKREKALSSFQNRYVDEQEFGELQNLIDDYNIQNGFYQELVQDTEWLPDFSRTQPFQSSLAKPVWHWKSGFIE